MRKLSLLALVLATAACRDSGGGDDTQNPDSSTGGTDTKIQDIQDPAMTSGTPVTVKGVVITAIDSYGGKTGDFWVQEPEGGEYSGIHVFGAPLDQVAALAIGDVVDISGAEKDDFMYSDFDPGYAITELKPVSGGVMSVAKTGANMVLVPQVVDARMIGGLADFVARDAEWEKWEGVLIKIENVTATQDQDCVGSACSDPTLQKFEVTGGVVVESAIAAFPVGDMDPAAVNRDQCIASVTGVLDYFFDYLLLPRTTAELVLTAGTCPTEDNMVACTDGIDNDGNGFMDCNDNACVGAVASCRSVTTISAIQTATTPPTGGIELQNVYVTALERTTGTQKPRSMYVQTSPGASVSNGILIFGNNSTDLSAYAVGDRVNVIGKVVEFNDMTGTGTLTEVSLIAHSAGTGMGTIAPVTGQTATALSVDVAGELHESVLVNLEDVKLTVVGTMAGFYVGTMVQGATTFKFDDNLFRLTNAVDTCFDNIQGVWSYQVYDNAWYFLPTGAVVDTTGGACP